MSIIIILNLLILKESKTHIKIEKESQRQGAIENFN